jgi:predicted Zn-dependent protease
MNMERARTADRCRFRAGSVHQGSAPDARFLSEAECHALFGRLVRLASGGGETRVVVQSRWTGNLRWARNSVISAGDVRSTELGIDRMSGGVSGSTRINVLDDRHLQWAVARAERALALETTRAPAMLDEPEFVEPTFPRPPIWFDATYTQAAEERAALMERVVAPAAKAGLLSAGYLEVSATGQSSMSPRRVWYNPYTWAQYSVTVRMPDGSGSGWAGMDHPDWTKIDAEHLTQVALEKCLQSRNPVRLEPGRYTAILEPQAVGDLVQPLFSPFYLARGRNEGELPAIRKTDPKYKSNPNAPFNDGPGYSKLGQKVIDARLSVTTDCMDPLLAFPSFGLPENPWQVYYPARWITDGVLTNMAYDRTYAVEQLGKNNGGLPQYGEWKTRSAFHMTVKGETVSVEEMIATTKRGILVTRFSGVQRAIPEGDTTPDPSLLLNGYTRDGLWLIENGKVSKPVKNFLFTESPLFVLNQVEQLGVPQRIFNRPYPIVVPALKVRDFNFTALSDSV